MRCELRCHGAGRAPEGCDILVAVAGQPNVGKSTLFNVLTGGRARVANWPGVTVEREVGTVRYGGRRVCLVDLPGTYGLSASSADELVAREFVVKEAPDVVVVLADATAPERTMLLPVQVLELTGRVVVALTKADMAHPHGIHINVDKLSASLGVPVVLVSAVSGEGLSELLECVVRVAEGPPRRPIRVDYGPLERYVSEVERLVGSSKALSGYPPRWAALRLLEGDEALERALREGGEGWVLERVAEIRAEASKALGREPADVIVARRFAFIDKLLEGAVVRAEGRWRRLEVLDRVFVRPLLGPVASLAILFLVFLTAFTVNLGFPLNVALSGLGFERAASLLEEYSLSGLLEGAFSRLAEGVREVLLGAGAPGWLAALLSDGVIPGVGAVLSFLPLVTTAFFLLAVLEDSGIAPRIAVALNSLFSRFWLTGRAVYPFMVSLGCNVPGVLTARSTPDKRERVATVLASPFIPCQARLVVLLAFASVLFKSAVSQALAVVSAYAVALLAALATAYLYSRLSKGEERPELVLEIPPLHAPSLRVVWWLTWGNARHFLRKAGTVIFALSVVTWFLLYTGPGGFDVPPEESYGAAVGRFLAGFVELYGLEHEAAWKVAFGVLHGFVAKEAFLEALALLSPGEDLGSAIAGLGMGPSQAIGFLLFFTLYVPCLATVAVVARELGSLKLTLALVAYMVAIASLVGSAAYAVLSLLGL